MKSGKIIRTLFVGALLFAGFAFAGAGVVNAQTDSVEGEWNAAMNHPGGVSNFKIIFKVDGEKLTGTVKRSAGDRPLEGTVKGNELQFSYSVVYGDNTMTMSLTGKREGDKITGLVFFGESGQSSDWSATRAASEER